MFIQGSMTGRAGQHNSGELENPFQGQSQTIKNVCISPNIENLHRHNLTLIPKQRKQ